MMIKIFETESFNDNYFMSHVAQRGTVVAFEKRDPKNQWVAAKPWDGSGAPIGLLMTDVVDIDLSKESYLHSSVHSTVKGGKVRLLTRGRLIGKFGKGLRLPVGQPIYVDPNTGFLTWKCLSVQVGKLRRPQDKDGNCLIEVNF